LLLSGEVQFVGWSAYKALNVQFSQEVLNGYSINAPKNYENTRIYRLGGQFAATERLDLRLDAYLDESPVPGEFLNPETPSMNKMGLSAGLSFRPLERLSVDLAFTYVQTSVEYGLVADEGNGNEKVILVLDVILRKIE
jgi:long-chain fatty acid transport protein